MEGTDQLGAGTVSSGAPQNGRGALQRLEADAG